MRKHRLLMVGLVAACLVGLSGCGKGTDEATESSGNDSNAGAQAPTGTDTVTLRFHPTPGQKRTMRVTIDSQTTNTVSEQPSDGGGLKVFTMVLESGSVAGDGQVPVNVAITAIREQMRSQGQTFAEYDSTQPPTQISERIGRQYAGFIGRTFTVEVSPEGQVVNPGIDALLTAVAESRVDNNEAGAESSGGTRAEKVLAMKEQLENTSSLGRGELRMLLDLLFATFPGTPVQQGQTWDGAMVVAIGVPLELETSYTLDSVDDATCSLAVAGKADTREEPIVLKMGEMTLNGKFAGTCDGTSTVDRQAGWLLKAQYVTNVDGETTWSVGGPDGQSGTSETSTKLTTTVESIE